MNTSIKNNLLKKLGALVVACGAFSAFTQTTVNFTYTGAAQYWTVPPCVTTISVEAAGGEGGGGGINGGDGATVTGDIPVTPGDVLEINVGGLGGCHLATYGGGGDGGDATLTMDRGCAGGGASDVRFTPYAVGDRVIVAAGGGGMSGGSTDADGGNGGCATGNPGADSWGDGGGGGSAVAGGAGGGPWGGGGWGFAGGLGFGGAGSDDICFARGPGGGGGGGFYGGGGGGSDCWAGGGSYGGGGGGGGSSLTPVGGTCTAGDNTGDGYITIIYTPAAPEGGTVTAAPDELCEGLTTDLTLAGYFGDIQWEWAPTSAGPFAPTSAADTLDMWTTPGLWTNICYRAAVTSCGTTVYSDTVCIVVNPNPGVAAPADITVCDGDEVTLTAVNPDGAVIGWTAPVIDGAPFTPPVGVNVYTVTASLLGCDSTDDVTVTVNPYPAIDAGPDQAVCDGDLITVTASNPDGAIIAWTGGITDGTPFTQPVGTVTYTVSGDLLGCVSYDDVNITVNALPSIYAGSDVQVCEGFEVTLAGEGADWVGPGGSYTWDGGVTDGTPFIPPVGIPTLTTTYTVTGTDANGCQNTDQVNVIVIANPIVQFVADSVKGCEPFMPEFTNLSSPVGASCEWIFGDGNTGASCGTITNEYEQDGFYDVTLTVTLAEGCVSTVTYNDYIEVIPFPVASFQISDQVVDINDPSIQFVNSSLFATDYTWDFGDGSPLTGIESPSHLFPETPNEDYLVTLWSRNELGCMDSVSKTIFVSDVITFYIPNIFTPDGDEYNETFQPIFYSGHDPYDFNMKIFNRWGELVFESFNAAQGWDGTYGSKGLVEDGTFTWFIEFKETMSDKRHKHRGHVTILK